MPAFDELAASRRAWIDGVLRQWCRQAPLVELKKAEAEWADIAGRVDPAATLWTWAWSRFPDLVHEGMPGLNETSEVRVRLTDGREAVGFPDARQSVKGRLVLIPSATQPRQRIVSQELCGPFSIDEIASVERTQT